MWNGIENPDLNFAGNAPIPPFWTIENVDPDCALYGPADTINKRDIIMKVVNGGSVSFYNELSYHTYGLSLDSLVRAARSLTSGVGKLEVDIIMDIDGPVQYWLYPTNVKGTWAKYYARFNLHLDGYEDTLTALDEYGITLRGNAPIPTDGTSYDIPLKPIVKWLTQDGVYIPVTENMGWIIYPVNIDYCKPKKVRAKFTGSPNAEEIMLYLNFISRYL
jgi:hypothetical protein